MTDKFYPIPLADLLKRILYELSTNTEVLNLPKSRIVNPKFYPDLKIRRFDKVLSTPYGVAAGPHTQLAQNIIASWLFGARYIELKTIQTLDELQLSKPCIDMQDEGYNCEWSQELKIQQSFDEYLNAWIIIHILNHYLDWGKSPETIFNMSVGYNLEGILNENVQWFLDKMNDCSVELNLKKNQIRSIYPSLDEVNIPSQISNNITLSTMHGCPAHEIEEIALYLIQEKKLHTIIKLNPTLLGAKDLRNILNDKLNWPIFVPDIAFEHDLKFNDALKIISNLEKAAQISSVYFGLKLTNTLEVKNQKTVFDAKQDMMYLSGRALHPISINVSSRLQTEFNGRLDISFSAGIDAFNLVDVLECGIQPITVCSDLLKPGGYSRMAQYAENIQKYLNEKKMDCIPNPRESNRLELLQKLQKYATDVINMETYAFHLFESKNIKTERKLNAFDCTYAPCVDTCPTNQNIPEYLYHAAKGNFQKSFEVILQNNAFPQTLGLVCEHNCQTKCTRINYDNPLQIREIKNFVGQSGSDKHLTVPPSNGLKIAIIGAGPAGLSAAYFLALEGFEIELFETENSPGGIVHKAIPYFRMPNDALYDDIKRIESLGIKINYNSPIDQKAFESLKLNYDYVFIGTGAQKMKKLQINGSQSSKVLDPLLFLMDFKNKNAINPGNHVIVIGGGNTAMDVARAAKKLQNGDGEVSIVYRRSLAQMPAEPEEILDAKAEGIRFFNLLSPLEIIDKQKALILQCQPMKLSEKLDADGRQKVEKSSAAIIEFEASAIIAAIGQEVVFDFSDENLDELLKNPKQLRSGKVFLGGDARHGAASIVQAVGDGQNTAKEIIETAKLEHRFAFNKIEKSISDSQHLSSRSKRIFGEANPKRLLNAEQIMKEASRCLACDDYCNICVGVCPNRANFNYTVEPQILKTHQLFIKNNSYSLIPDSDYSITQKQQILNIADFCNECGNCTTFCPSAGSPYKEKPHVYLSQESYAENKEGYFLENKNKDFVLNYKNENLKSSLCETENYFAYTIENIKVIFRKSDFSIKDVEINSDKSVQINLRRAYEMRFVLEGAKQLNRF